MSFMNPTHLHLLLNHVPILGSAFGILLLIYGLFSRNRYITSSALITLVISAVFTIPVFLTGEQAEESVENIAGVSKNLIENHEEGGEIAMWLMQALGILSFAAWLLNCRENPLGKTITLCTLILALITFGFIAKVGNDGGKIRHTEISNSSQTQSDKQQNTNEQNESNDND